MAKRTSAGLLVVLTGFIFLISTMGGCQKEAKIGYFNQIPPGPIPEMFAPGMISTNADEYALAFTPDGSELYFTRRGGALSQSTIMIMKQEWDAPQVASFSGTYADSEPFITPDGKKLFFGSRRPLKDDEPVQWPHIWTADRTGPGWARPRPLGPPFLGIFVMYPTLTKDKTVYFTGQGGIHRSVMKSKGYEDIERLGDSINAGPAAHPFVAPDEDYLIFNGRDRSDGFGGWDLYISFRRKDGSWTEARNMGNHINSNSNELCANVSPDGKYVFFASNRQDDVLNIFWVDAIVIDHFRHD
jgi:hypothetical protein